MRKRPPLPRLVRPKDHQISALEREILRKVDDLAKLSTDDRMTWYWQNLTNRLRHQGKLLPGDGKGGLIYPKRDET